MQMFHELVTHQGVNKENQINVAQQERAKVEEQDECDDQNNLIEVCIEARLST